MPSRKDASSIGIIRWSKNHVPDVPHHPIRRRIPPEPSVVNKSIRHSRRACPSIDGQRGMLVCHVDMKLVVARDLEEDHLAVVRERTVRCQSCDGGLQRRNVGRPRIGAKRVPGRDDPRAFAVAVIKGAPGQDFHISTLLSMSPLYARRLQPRVLYCTARDRSRASLSR